MGEGERNIKEARNVSLCDETYRAHLAAKPTAVVFVRSTGSVSNCEGTFGRKLCLSALSMTILEKGKLKIDDVMLFGC